MPVIVKFIVASEENAHRVSQMAKQHYAKLSQKNIDKEYSVSAFLNSANSFTREWLMSFEVTGEDEERQEEPLAFVELLSANLPKEAEGNKPVYIEKITHGDKGNGVKEVVNRALEIAIQRRHDVIWAEIPEGDDAVKNTLAEFGFVKSGMKENKQLFKKIM